MIEAGSRDTSERSEQLHRIARAYVNVGLGKKNFDAIPYHEDVVFRAPVNPGGSDAPITGRERLRSSWWAPMASILADVTVVDTYVNGALSAVTVEFQCGITSPTCLLRIVDRFKISSDGEITEHENFFDPRDIASPGWRETHFA